MSDDLIWAASKLVKIRQKYGNGDFTTDELDRLFNILGREKFIELTEPVKSGEGVWTKESLIV